MYVAGSWVALEVAGTLTESFGLPSWFPAFALGLLVVGLPITLATALMQDGPSALEEPGGGGMASGGARRIFTWRNAAAGAVGAFALWGLVAAGWLILGDGSPALANVAGERPSIAVLPFNNLSRDAADAHIADGLHDEILTQLHKIGGLKVISRTSVLAYRDAAPSLREIGRELGVGTVLEGTVRVEGQRIRATAQLIDAETDGHLWADDYDATLTAENLFAIQRDVALAIARELRARLSEEERARIEREPTRDIEAYRHYLRGRQNLEQWTAEGVRLAIEHFERALEEDPEFALAHAGLAEAYAVGVTEGAIDRWQDIWNGERAAARALELDPKLGAAYAARGMVRSWAAWDWEGGSQDFARALELDPGDTNLLHWYAHHLFTVGRVDDALEMSRRAVELDPLSPAMHLQLAWNLFFAGDHEQALASLDRSLELDPGYPVSHLLRGWLFLAEGRLDLALAARERWLPLGGAEYYIEGCAAARRGDRARAEELIRQAEAAAERGAQASHMWPRYELAGIHACIGNKDEAFEWLEGARLNREGMMIMIPSDPRFASLHDDSRFAALLGRMGL